MCRCEYVGTSAYKGHKRALELLELETLRVVSCPTWVLETELSSSGRAPNTLND